MDITDLYTVDNHEAGSEMQVKDQNGKLLDMYITVVGPDSVLYRTALHKARQAMLNGDSPDNILLTAKTLADSTLGWRGFLNDGVEIEFSVEKVEQLYLNAPYITDQIDEFTAKRENFTQG